MNIALSDIPLPPQPPADLETRNVIDKFAAYVAKNGPGFEEISRQKNADNPKFGFLFGGEHHQYYQFRLMWEIQQLKGGMIGYNNNQNQPNYPPPHVPIQPVPLQTQSFDIGESRAQVDSIRNQIKESENNLQAQYEVLQKQKEMKVDEAVKNSEEKRIAGLLEQVGLNIEPFTQLLDHLQSSCSKDTISNSKKWIFDYCTTDRLREIILTYLLFRVKSPGSTDAFRLHILYLINDWAHYCQRKKMDSIRQMLSRYVPQLYAYTASSPTIDQSTSDKLDKLIGVWEGHKYFDDHCYKQLRNPSTIIATGKAAEYAEHARYSAEIDKEILTTYNGYKKQHQEFERHMIGQIAALEGKIAAEEARLAAEKRRQEEQARQEQQQRKSRFDQKFEDSGPDRKIPSLFETQTFPPHHPPHPHPPHQHQPPMHPLQPEIRDEDLFPKAAYYELPAGMMIPLVQLEDVTYKPIKIEDMRLPRPEPPSERLVNALNYFYNFHPTPENPRDAEGWEKKGLVDYFAKKMEIHKNLEKEMKEQGKTFEDAIENKYIAEKEKRKISRSHSRSRSRSRSRSSSRSSTSSSSSSRSRRSRRSRSQTYSRSPSRSRSRSRSQSSSPKRQPISRSPSPEARPSFSKPKEKSPPRVFKQPAISFQMKKPQPLDSQNKGAQLLAKMGWEGGGLGASQQGIVEPVEGGEVREKVDQFRGIGSKSDIYEEYRKKMSNVKKYNRFNRDF